MNNPKESDTFKQSVYTKIRSDGPLANKQTHDQSLFEAPRNTARASLTLSQKHSKGFADAQPITPYLTAILLKYYYVFLQ